jgi:hypothetical protein
MADIYVQIFPCLKRARGSRPDPIEQEHKIRRIKMAIVQPIGTGSIDRIEGSGASMLILTTMVILFGAAAYFTGRFYGQVGMYAVIGGFVIVFIGLLALSGISFG